ncbi:hypothetical protein WJX74_007706 [Apatococcus lobatus]|uniref:Uncharacterized protein n=1 Tax=Apatococcus lobatus TaxID=904363 RepID=A0AAW1QU94_9CHLO
MTKYSDGSICFGCFRRVAPKSQKAPEKGTVPTPTQQPHSLTGFDEARLLACTERSLLQLAAGRRPSNSLWCLTPSGRQLDQRGRSPDEEVTRLPISQHASIASGSNQRLPSAFPAEESGRSSPANDQAALDEHIGPHLPSGIAALTAAAARLERLQHANAMEAMQQASAASLEHQAALMSSPFRHQTSSSQLTSEYSAGSSPERSPSSASSDSRQATAASSPVSRSASASPRLVSENLGATSPFPRSASPVSSTAGSRASSTGHRSAPESPPPKAPKSWQLQAPASFGSLQPSVSPNSQDRQACAKQAMHKHPKSAAAPHLSLCGTYKDPRGSMTTNPAAAPFPGELPQVHVEVHGRSLVGSKTGEAQREAGDKPLTSRQLQDTFHASAMNATHSSAPTSLQPLRQIPRQLLVQPQLPGGLHASSAGAVTSSHSAHSSAVSRPEQMAMCPQTLSSPEQPTLHISNVLYEPDQSLSSTHTAGLHEPAKPACASARGQLLIKQLVSSAAEQSDGDSEAGHDQVDFMMTAMEAQMEQQQQQQQLEQQLDLCVVSHDPMPMPDDMEPRMTGLPDTPSGHSRRAPCDVWDDDQTHLVAQQQQQQQQPMPWPCRDLGHQQQLRQQLTQQLPQQSSKLQVSSIQKVFEPEVEPGHELGASSRQRKSGQSLAEPERPITPTWQQLRLGHSLTTILEDSSDTEESEQPLESDRFATQQLPQHRDDSLGEEASGMQRGWSPFLEPDCQPLAPCTPPRLYDSRVIPSPGDEAPAQMELSSIMEQIQHLGARLSAAGTALVDVRKESLGLRTEAEILCQAGKHGPVPYWEVLDSAEVHAKQLLNDIKILGTLPKQPRL